MSNFDSLFLSRTPPLFRTVVWSNDVGEQAQSACFSPDGEVIVVGTVTGKWVVLNAATREVFSVNQVSQKA